MPAGNSRRSKESSRPPRARPASPPRASSSRIEFLKPADRIVLYNTGSGLKYLDAYSAYDPNNVIAS